MGLVYIGRVVLIDAIPGADKIERLEVVLGKGGRWSGCALKGQFVLGESCQVYLQDSLLPHADEFEFMSKHHWRVRMCKFLGTPSEVLIMPQAIPGNLGDDVTEVSGVTKYEKPIPASISGEVVGHFPQFIPKTDEPNAQSVPDMIDALCGLPFYSTVKVDGTSTTCFLRDGHFGICSRNYELRESNANTLWQIARQHELEEKVARLGFNVALQWETCGPGIQGNTSGLSKPDMRLFNIYNIDTHQYLGAHSFFSMARDMDLPTVEIIEERSLFDMDIDALRTYAEGTYDNGKQREGVVIRPITEQTIEIDGETMRLSFKSINLLYKEG